MSATITNARLSELLAETRNGLASFTDPPTATLQIRGVELLAVLEEVDKRRAVDRAFIEASEAARRERA